MMTEIVELADKPNKFVLIIDDDDSIGGLLKHIVESEGFRCDTASDGEEGLEKIHKLLPDLVILDLMLPRCGGFELLRKMQAGETAQIPVIIVTGRYADQTTAEILRQEPNVREFFEKPIKMQVLRSSLHKILKTVPSGLNV